MSEPAPQQPVVNRAPKRKMGWIARILVVGGSLGTVMGVGLAIVFAAFKLPAASMWPTLSVGERVFVNRLAKQPFRGSLVVFRHPEHRQSTFAKRIVGLAGDTVAVKDGQVTINGWKVPRCMVGRASYRDEEMPGNSGRHDGTLFVEWLGIASYLVFEEKTAVAVEGETHEWKVAPGQYFVLGDNRNNSHDSRQWFAGAGGGVPLEDTLGRIVGHDTPQLPPGAGDLEPALAACLAKRPAETDPPAPK
ncbi:MAG: Signal peptidase [Labilithrix sp.]|nr:Signal peptidase [Labilithrix sp.]